MKYIQTSKMFSEKLDPNFHLERFLLNNFLWIILSSG